jgi:hypothetical protein
VETHFAIFISVKPGIELLNILSVGGKTPSLHHLHETLKIEVVFAGELPRAKCLL